MGQKTTGGTEEKVTARLSRLLLPGLLLLSGCSTFKLAYNNADFVGTWIVGRYFDLDGEQKRSVDAAIERLMMWHRREELPELIRLLENFKTGVENGLTPDDIRALFDTAQKRYEKVIDAGAPDLVQFFRGLSDDQIRQLEEKFREDSLEFVEEALPEGTMQERLERRWKRTRKFLTGWTGDLTDAQEANFSALSYSLPYTTGIWFDNRNLRRQRFILLLKEERQTPSFDVKLIQWMKDRTRDERPEYRQAMQQMVDRSLEMTIAIHRQLTEKQKQHAIRRLQGYIDDLRDLHAMALK